jgi:uncharacterized membrane protein
VRLSVRKLAIAGVLGAVSIVMGYVPFLGFIPVPTPAGNATILQIPAIIAGVTEGPGVGLAVGFIFGLLSMLRGGGTPFANPLVSVLPRLFIGVTAAYVFMALRRWNLGVALAVAGVVGTLTNTVLVLGLLVLMKVFTPGAAWTIALVQGLPEMVVAGIIVTALGLGLARARVLKPAPGKV